VKLPFGDGIDGVIEWLRNQRGESFSWNQEWIVTVPILPRRLHHAAVEMRYRILGSDSNDDLHSNKVHMPLPTLKLFFGSEVQLYN
jgi:hypothetical protein